VSALHGFTAKPRLSKYETAAMRWLERYLTEGSPRLRHFTEITGDLAAREG
jgi:hypothetical protein